MKCSSELGLGEGKKLAKRQKRYSLAEVRSNYQDLIFQKLAIPKKCNIKGFAFLETRPNRGERSKKLTEIKSLVYIHLHL